VFWHHCYYSDCCNKQRQFSGCRKHKQARRYPLVSVYSLSGLHWWCNASAMQTEQITCSFLYKLARCSSQSRRRNRYVWVWLKRFLTDTGWRRSQPEIAPFLPSASAEESKLIFSELSDSIHVTVVWYSCLVQIRGRLLSDRLTFKAETITVAAKAAAHSTPNLSLLIFVSINCLFIYLYRFPAFPATNCDEIITLLVEWQKHSRRSHSCE